MFLKIFQLLSLVSLVHNAILPTSNEDVAIEMMRENRNLIFLFVKKDCTNCRFEQSLIAARDELESTLDAKVLKLQSSQLQRIYDYHKQDAALVFIRKGVPLLYPYQDPDTAGDIFEFFNQFRDPVVKELDDSTFEHLTQASTGATTGDWLIQFYDTQCVDCNRLTATWESVGAKLRSRMNVAKVNRGTKGTQTAKRFKVQNVPEFILLKQGKVYRYNLKKYDIETFVGFATEWHRQITAEKVPVPKTAFDNVLEVIVEKLREIHVIKENPIIFIGLASFGFLFILILLFSRSKKPKEEGVKKQK